MNFIDRVFRTVSSIASEQAQRCFGFISNFIQNRDTKMDVKQPEYKDLLPTDNIQNGDEYIMALRWAFENKKIRNTVFFSFFNNCLTVFIIFYFSENQ